MCCLLVLDLTLPCRSIYLRGLPLGGLSTIFCRQLARQVGVSVLFLRRARWLFPQVLRPVPRPGQIFTVGSISWIINADGIGELLEPVQIQSAPIILSPATADPISDPTPRSTPSTTRRPLPRYQRRQINNDDLIASIDRVGLKLAIAGSALDTLIQRRPPSDPDLLEAARKTPGATAPPFGFTDAASRRPGQRRPSSRRPDRRPASAGRQHASRRPTLRSASPNHPGGEPGLRVPGLYGDHHRGDHQATFPPSVPRRRDLQHQRRQSCSERRNRGGTHRSRGPERQPCAAPSRGGRAAA